MSNAYCWSSRPDENQVSYPKVINAQTSTVVNRTNSVCNARTVRLSHEWRVGHIDPPSNQPAIWAFLIPEDIPSLPEHRITEGSMRLFALISNRIPLMDITNQIDAMSNMLPWTRTMTPIDTTSCLTFFGTNHALQNQTFKVGH